MSNKEKRILVDQSLQARALTDDQGNKIIEGYAAVFNQRSKLLFESGRIFYEVIERGAFDEVLLDENLDVVMTYQHNTSEPLARYNRGKGVNTLGLSIDEKGLKFRAILNNTTAANDTYERVASGDCFECSFIFSVMQDNERWENENGDNVRYISKVSGLYDVSVVVNGAYSNTDVAVAERSFKEATKEPEPEAPNDTYFDQFKIDLIELEK